MSWRMGPHWAFGREGSHGEIQGTVLKSCCLGVITVIVLAWTDKQHTRPRSVYFPIFPAWGIIRLWQLKLILNHYIIKTHFLWWRGKYRPQLNIVCCYDWQLEAGHSTFIVHCYYAGIYKSNSTSFCFICTKAVSHNRCSFFILNLCNAGWRKSPYLHVFINMSKLKFRYKVGSSFNDRHKWNTVILQIQSDLCICDSATEVAFSRIGVHWGNHTLAVWHHTTHITYLSFSSLHCKAELKLSLPLL